MRGSDLLFLQYPCDALFIPVRPFLLTYPWLFPSPPPLSLSQNANPPFLHLLSTPHHPIFTPVHIITTLALPFASEQVMMMM